MNNFDRLYENWTSDIDWQWFKDWDKKFFKSIESKILKQLNKALSAGIIDAHTYIKIKANNKQRSTAINKLKDIDQLTNSFNELNKLIKHSRKIGDYKRLVEIVNGGGNFWDKILFKDIEI